LKYFDSLRKLELLTIWNGESNYIAREEEYANRAPSSLRKKLKQMPLLGVAAVALHPPS